MTGPVQLTAAGVSEHLAFLSRELDKLIKQIADAETAAVNAREDFTLAHAKAFLAAEGAMDVRKYTAIEATHVQRISAELAEAEVR